MNGGRPKGFGSSVFQFINLFPRAMSQAAVLARTVGECREGQIPRPLGRCKLDIPLLAAWSLIFMLCFHNPGQKNVPRPLKRMWMPVFFSVVSVSSVPVYTSS